MGPGRNRTADERFEEAVKLYAHSQPQRHRGTLWRQRLGTWQGLATAAVLVLALVFGLALTYRWHATKRLGITCGPQQDRPVERRFDPAIGGWKYYCP